MPNSGYFDIPFSEDGTLTSVPDDVQSNGSVSYTQGFGILYSTPTASGGYDFPRGAHNQILNDITTAIQNQQQNAFPPFITSAMNGGSAYSYPAGPIVYLAGVLYQSLVASNTDMPPSAKWLTINVGATNAVTGANHTFAAGDNSVLTLRSNSGSVMVDTLPGTSPGVLGAYWKGTVENNDASALYQIIVGSGADLNGSATGSITLGPGQKAELFSDGTNYWSKTGAGSRIRLGANTTLYVATTGSDSANNGIASGTPFATLQHAWNMLCTNYDLNGFTATIKIADGTYAAGIISTLSPIGGDIVINGNSGTPSNVLIAVTSQDAFSFINGRQPTIENLKITTTTGGDGIYAQGATTIIPSNIVFGAVAGYDMRATLGANIIPEGNITVSGNATGFIFGDESGSMDFGAITVTMSGTPAFSQATAVAFNGNINCAEVTFSGAATGVRYIANLNGVINTNGGGATFIPGNSGGTTATGGQYA